MKISICVNYDHGFLVELWKGRDHKEYILRIENKKLNEIIENLLLYMNKCILI
jgi:hypothetical protein